MAQSKEFPKLYGQIWFSPMGSIRPVGIVIAEHDDGEGRRAFIGLGLDGENEQRDAQHIAMVGARFPYDNAMQMINARHNYQFAPYWTMAQIAEVRGSGDFGKVVKLSSDDIRLDKINVIDDSIVNPRVGEKIALKLGPPKSDLNHFEILACVFLECGSHDWKMHPGGGDPADPCDPVEACSVCGKERDDDEDI